MTSGEQGGGIVLREVDEADLAIFFEHQREPEANAMAAFPARDREAFLAHWHTKVLAGATVIARTVICDGKVAGNVVSWVDSGRRLVGYWLGREFWGQGIATGALSRFTALAAHRPLHAFVAQANTGSIRVLEKCGFRLVGEQACSHDDDEVAVVAEFVYVLSD